MNITCTGIDERTDLQHCYALAHEHEGVEFGILLSAKPEGRNRYPSLEFIALAANTLMDKLSIHICGKAARKALLAQAYDFVHYAGRLQINGGVYPCELSDAFERFDGQIITQYGLGNDELEWTDWFDDAHPHALLVDGSGGRGISPATWKAPECTTKPVGFAGGLGPDNLAYELQKISAVAGPGAWVDMETKLRTDDWFDISKAEACIEIARRFSLS